MSKNCCKDKAAYFKVKDNHQSSDLLKSPTPTSKISFSVLPVFEHHFALDHQNNAVLNYHAPLVLYDNPIYLQYRVLLI